MLRKSLAIAAYVFFILAVCLGTALGLRLCFSEDAFLSFYFSERNSIKPLTTILISGPDEVYTHHGNQLDALGHRLQMKA